MNAPWQPPAGDPTLSSTLQPPTGILIDRVRKIYPGRKGSAEVVALDDISLSVPKGSILGVIGRSGAGNGMVVQRGFKAPPSYHDERLRNAPVGYFFDVMTHGFGAMQDYASQVPVADRWAIAAYIRALQISHNATVDDVPASERGKLDQPAGAKAAEGEGHKAGGQE